MNRRNFLKLLGLAAFVPLVPVEPKLNPREKLKAYFSQEAYDDIRVWCVTDLDEETRRQIYQSDGPLPYPLAIKADK